MKYIGIDLGSSFVKAVLFDLDKGKMTAVRKCPSPKKNEDKNPYVFEIPAQKIVELVCRLIDEFTYEYSDTEGVVISTQMHGFVYSIPGKEDMYISWQDMRCMDPVPGKKESYLEWLEGRITPEMMKNNGVYLKPSLGVCNLYTLLEQNGTIPRDGMLYTLGSYVIHALTGENTCHITNAAPLGIVDVKHRCWDQEILKLLGLENVRLPRLVAGDYKVCGEYCSNGHSLKIHPDYGDMQVAMLGSNLEDGDAAVNIATGAQVIRPSKQFYPGEYEIRPWFEGRYLYTISNMPAGRNLDVLVNFLRETAETLTGKEVDAQTVWERVHAEALKRDPDLKVEISFYKNPYFPNGGAIRGITQSNLHLETIFYAAFENMAYTYRRFIRELDAQLGDTKRIVCAGGVSWRTPELYRMIGRVLEKPCCLSPMSDEALAGMYRLSLVCSGQCKTLEESKNFKINQE